MPEDPTDQFIKFLRENGYLVTRPRKWIAEVIFTTPGHLSVEDIQNLLRQKKISSSIATTYRALDMLIKSGLVIQHRFGKRFKLYEAMRQDQHHDHLICTNCGKVEEFKNDTIEGLQVRVAKDHNFDITNHKLELYGRCRSCSHRIYHA